MNHGKYVFAQFMEWIPRYEFDQCVQRYAGEYRLETHPVESRIRNRQAGMSALRPNHEILRHPGKERLSGSDSEGAVLRPGNETVLLVHDRQQDGIAAPYRGTLYPIGIGFRYFTVTDSEQVLFFFFRELIGNK